MRSDLVRPAELARRLGVSRSWLYEAARAGLIPSRRLGGPEGPLRFVEDEVDAWLEEACRAWKPARNARDSSAAR
jgi:excisionase family DNA binding protein